MKFRTPLIFALCGSLLAVPVWAMERQGNDLEASAHLTLKECLHMQAAKNDGASRDQMKEACKWTRDDTGATTNSLSITDRPRPVDSAPYGALPGTIPPP
jgi:hypothetical protein